MDSKIVAIYLLAYLSSGLALKVQRTTTQRTTITTTVSTTTEEPVKLQPNQRASCIPSTEDVQDPPNRVYTGDRLSRLRQEMKKENSVRAPTLDAYIVTSDDEHQSEYVADKDRRVEFISGFSGSSGDAVVTKASAALWTDGRYHLQADEQLSCDWLLMKEGQPDTPNITDWLRQVLRSGSKVGADASLIPQNRWLNWSKHLAMSNISLVEVGNNAVDRIWPKNKTKLTTPVKINAYVHNIAYAGATWQSKVAQLREKLSALGASAMVVTALDEVAWLLNIRAADIPYNPFLRAFVIVETGKLHLYVDDKSLSQAVRKQLKTDDCFDSPFCTRVHQYNTIVSDVRTFSQIWNKVVLPAEFVYNKAASHAIYTAVPVDKRLPLVSPIIFMKAKKNEKEIAGMRAAHVRDAVALCDFLAEFEEAIDNNEDWDEWKVSETLDQYRREQNLSRGMSFGTIAGFGPNGAQPHYEANSNSSLKIDRSSTLVLDSGGHYDDGTTDVTRTLHFGTPTDLEREAYTRVLMGQIQLATLVFPENVTTTMVDVLARGPLWHAGLDFMHGTGHGIGAFLGVHESPINVAYYSRPSEWVPFKEGYFFSDEPGYYHKDKFGVRLENVLEVVKADTAHGEDVHYFKFHTATLVPYEPKLMDLSLMNSQHCRWLNDYNARIRDVVGGELKKQMRMRGFFWMMKKTANIPEHCSIRGTAPPHTAAFTLLLPPTIIMVLGLLQ